MYIACDPKSQGVKCHFVTSIINTVLSLTCSYFMHDACDGRREHLTSFCCIKMIGCISCLVCTYCLLLVVGHQLCRKDYLTLYFVYFVAVWMDGCMNDVETFARTQ